MLYVNAHEETNYDPGSGYVNFPYKVGEFIIPGGTPPPIYSSVSTPNTAA